MGDSLRPRTSTERPAPPITPPDPATADGDDKREHHSRPRTEVDDNRSDSEESLKQRIERLGRERPACFDSTWQEAGFVFSIAMSQVLAVSEDRITTFY